MFPNILQMGQQAPHRSPAGGVWYLHFTCIHLNLPVWEIFSLSPLSVDLVGYMSVVSFQIRNRVGWDGKPSPCMECIVPDARLYVLVGVVSEQGLFIMPFSMIP